MVIYLLSSLRLLCLDRLWSEMCFEFTFVVLLDDFFLIIIIRIWHHFHHFITSESMSVDWNRFSIYCDWHSVPFFGYLISMKGPCTCNFNLTLDNVFGRFLCCPLFNLTRCVYAVYWQLCALANFARANSGLLIAFIHPFIVFKGIRLCVCVCVFVRLDVV